MVSAGMQWAIDKIAADRAAAGLPADWYDLRAARASNPPSELPLPDGLTLSPLTIADRPAVWAVPAGADPGRRIVYFHGGGYCAGDWGTHRALAGWLAAHAGAALLFVEYRLAPEHKFPAQMDDGWAAYRHALAHGPDGSRSDPGRLTVAGDSAGGGLAVAVALRCRDEGVRGPDAVAVLCGMLDFDETSSAFLQMSQRTRDMARDVVAWLRDMRHPWLSPVHADLVGLPPVLLQTGTRDYCRGDSEILAERARRAEVPVRLEVWPDGIHVWQRFAPKVEEADAALRAVAAFLNGDAATAAGPVPAG